MQTVSYSFYTNVKRLKDPKYEPVHIQYSDDLSGYGYNLEKDTNQIILYFGGSRYIAYNSVGYFGGVFDMPFLSADHYGSQNSKGRISLKSMKQTAEDLYDWSIQQYPGRKITVMGHSYGTGIATYLASVRDCDNLIIMSGYRDLSDLYNKFIPVFWGPTKLFITENIHLSKYAQNVQCDTYVIGSKADITLGAQLQQKIHEQIEGSELKIFEAVHHIDYLNDPEVIDYINEIMK
ncbi:MAG: alpha/beta hydrolase [Erysipelothrix sp.]|nr:alpha/beta hydrolase [Erysipelothrix sp.]